MGRPVESTAIRRTRQHGMIEVRTARGVWLPLRMLTPQATTNLESKLRRKTSHLLSDFTNFPEKVFDINLSDSPTEREDYDTDTPKVNATVEDTEQADGETADGEADGEPTDGEPTDEQADTEAEQEQQQPQQQDKESDMAMEDIVRRIAGELDDAQQQQWDTALDAKLDSFQQKLDNLPTVPTDKQLFTVTTTIEIKQAEKPDIVLVDGPFHSEFPDLYQNCIDGRHTFLPGPPGSGKSHAAEQVAKALGWQFASISLGPTTPESRLWGGMTANGEFHEPPFIRLARYAQDNPDSGAVFCLDEMDNGHGGVIATLNSALANGWFTAPNGDVVSVRNNFVLVACANTFGTGPTADFAGRNKLDPATLDRFTYIPWDTDLGVEAGLVRTILTEELAVAWLDVWNTVRKNVADHGLKLFVTMRGALSGAKIIAGGRPIDKALMLVLGNKVPADQWKKINPL